jgi:hypothetical protein
MIRRQPNVGRKGARHVGKHDPAEVLEIQICQADREARGACAPADTRR